MVFEFPLADYTVAFEKVYTDGSTDCMCLSKRENADAANQGVLRWP